MKKILTITILSIALSTLSSCGAPRELREIAYGVLDAPVQIHVYSDYKCAYCHDFFQNTFPKLKEDYIDTGKVFLTYHEFPIINEDSWSFAKSALCMYREKPTAFPALQGQIFNRRDVHDLAAMEHLNTSNGISQERYLACTNDPATEEFIVEQKRLAAPYHITSTPTFRIGNQLVSGNMPYEYFEQAIEVELETRN